MVSLSGEFPSNVVLKLRIPGKPVHHQRMVSYPMSGPWVHYSSNYYRPKKRVLQSIHTNGFLALFQIIFIRNHVVTSQTNQWFFSSIASTHMPIQITFSREFLVAHRTHKRIFVEPSMLFQTVLPAEGTITPRAIKLFLTCVNKIMSFEMMSHHRISYRIERKQNVFLFLV